MVTRIVVLCFNSIHRDLHLEICLIEVLITCVVGQIGVHRSNYVKLTVLIQANVNPMISKVILTTIHLFDLPRLH